MLSLRGTCAQPPPFQRCATIFRPKPESRCVWQRARDRNDDPDDHSTELRTDPSTAQNRNLPKSRSRRCALPSQKPGSATLKPPKPTAHHTNPSESQLPLHHRQSRNHKQNPIANRRTRLPLRHFQIPPSDFSMGLKTHFTGHIRQWFRNPPLRKAKRTPCGRVSNPPTAKRISQGMPAPDDHLPSPVGREKVRDRASPLPLDGRGLG